MARKKKNSDISTTHSKTEQTKVCKECKRELPISAFNYWNKEKNTHMIICKECEKKKNTKKHEERKELINSLKTGGCVCCGEDDINCLDFHHIMPEEKCFNMSAATGKTVQKILDEASKCVVVCANCHRKIHAGSIDISDYINLKQYHYTRKVFRTLYENFVEKD